MTAPVLFVIFNKPEATARVFETIRAAAPARLYVAADGPRPDRPGEAARCDAARAVIRGVDWPCMVRTLFQPDNLGCRAGVSAALEWFFRSEAQGIVLEDDMLACPSFFPYMTELLDRFAEDRRIAFVSGCNFAGVREGWAASYAFTRHLHMWGWGSWRRVWQAHDPALGDWPAARAGGLLQRTLPGRPLAQRHFRRLFDGARTGADYWEPQLQLSAWQAGQLTVIPRHNLVTNIGYGDAGSAHTHGRMPAFQRRAVPREMPFPLVHAEPAVDHAFDARIERRSLRIGPLAELKRLARAIIPRG